MKRSLLACAFVSITAAVFLGITGFSTIDAKRTGNLSARSALFTKSPVNFDTHATGLLSDGSTYVGTVQAGGAINKTGTYVMPTKVLGMALHCELIVTFPDGTLTIRMNCNMRTSNGRWKILEGTGAYADMKGQGSLVMPNDVDEILTGYVH
jgi:hypothetical protein